MDEIGHWTLVVWLGGIIISWCTIVLLALCNILYDLDWYLNGHKSNLIPNKILDSIIEEEKKHEEVFKPTDIDAEQWEDGSERIIFNFRGNLGTIKRKFNFDLRRELLHMKISMFLLACYAIIWPIVAVISMIEILRGKIDFRPLRWILLSPVLIQPENIFAIVRSCTSKHHPFLPKSRFCVCSRVGESVELEAKYFGESSPYHKIKDNLRSGYVNERDIEILIITA